MKKIVFLIIASFFIAYNLFAADIVTLKSGQSVEGDIIERNGDSVQIDAYGVKMTYFMDEVSSINGEKVVEAPKQIMPVAQNVSNVVSEPISQEIKEERIVTQTPGSLEITEQSTSKFTQTYPLPRNKNSSIGSADASKNSSLAVAGIMLGAFAIFFIIFVALYIYSAICLQIIANKTNTENAWLAWIPIANLFLMCKIASLSYLWLLGFLLGFIPMIGGILSMCLAGYFWYKIGIARSKEPQWIGALVAIPIVGLFVMGYIAFSD